MAENLTNLTGDELRAKASEQFANAAESFERCDTDGFVSQWASGLNGNLYRTQAEIADNGGKAEFWGLFDLNGERIAAKMIDSKFGLCWALCDANGKLSGRFVPFCQAASDLDTAKSEECPSFSGWVYGLNRVVENDSPECLKLRNDWRIKKEKEIKRLEKRVASWETKHGFSQRRELAPAVARIDGKGYGLSGSAWVATHRTDGGFPPGSKVV